VRAVGGDRLPVLFASAETSEDSVVRAFASGADDYVALPLRPGEFRERVAALLRRAYPDRFSAASFDVGPYHFDTSRRPQSLIQQGLFNICSEFVQNSPCRFTALGCGLCAASTRLRSTVPTLQLIPRSHPPLANNLG
jgi:hypothetical protein